MEADIIYSMNFAAAGAENGLKRLDFKDGRGPIGHRTLPSVLFLFCFIFRQSLLVGSFRQVLEIFSNPASRDFRLTLRQVGRA
jgi:hypothetical protein